MEIKKGTLVVINPAEEAAARFGIVNTVSPEAEMINVETSRGGSVNAGIKRVIPLAENCESIQEGLEKHKGKIIKTLAVMIYKLQKRIEALEIRRKAEDDTKAAIEKGKRELEQIQATSGGLIMPNTPTKQPPPYKPPVHDNTYPPSQMGLV